MRHSREPLAAAGLEVALFAEAREWHTRRLASALKKRGARVTVLSLRDCSIDTSLAHSLLLPGFSDRLPDAAFVRTVPGGTFEAVTLRLGILHALAREGVPVWNDPRAIERCVDKSTTSFLIARAGLPTPATWAVQGRADAATLVEREAGPKAPLVLKPLFGAQGRGLRLVRSVADLPEDDEVASVYYLQRYVGAARDWRDYRCFVCQGRVFAAMVRHGTGWITNIHQGARPQSHDADPRMSALAVAAADAVGAAYAGVDLMRRNGKWFVIEVNSMPAWSGLQSVTRFDLTRRLADAFCAAVAAGRCTIAPAHLLPS
jgi:RimK family alpha-L-glutamate ligase